MWERTVTIGSAGKTFSVTGWKVKHQLVLFCLPIENLVFSEFYTGAPFLSLYKENCSSFIAVFTEL